MTCSRFGEHYVSDTMKYSLRNLMRFSLRDMFWITVAVALVLGWWVDRSRLDSAKNEVESDARYLSRNYNVDDEPFAQATPKEAALYRKYHPKPIGSSASVVPTPAAPSAIRPAVEDPFARPPESSAPAQRQPRRAGR